MMDPEVVRRLRLTLHGNMLDRLGKNDLRALLADWERRGEALRTTHLHLITLAVRYPQENLLSNLRDSLAVHVEARAALEGGKP